MASLDLSLYSQHRTYKMDSMLNSEFKNIIKGLKNRTPNEIFIVDYKGYKVNVLPYLINAVSFNTGDAHLKAKLFCSLEDFNVDLLNFKLKDLNNDLIDIDYIYSLIPSFGDFNLRDIAIFSAYHKPLAFAEALIGLGAAIMNEIRASFDLSPIDYKDSTLANTQAFSIYFTGYWLLKMSPVTYGLLRRELKTYGFFERLDSFMPEDSLHFKYIKGEINGTTVFNNFLDRSTPRVCTKDAFAKELLNLATYGDLQDKPLTKRESYIIHYMSDILYDKDNIALKIHTTLACIKNYKDKLTNVEEIKSKYESKINELQAEKLSVASKNSALNSELTALSNTNKKLESELRRYKDSSDFETKIAKLNDDLAKSKHDYLELETTLDTLFKSKLELMQEVSALKKEIKKLKSSSSSSSLVEDAISNDFNETDLDTPTLEDMLEAIRGKKIALIGMDFRNTVLQKFEKAGFTGVVQFNKNTKCSGNYDFVVIFSQNCGHSEVRCVESLIRNKSAKVIYVNGSNFNNLVSLIYNRYKEDVE